MSGSDKSAYKNTWRTHPLIGKRCKVTMPDKEEANTNVYRVVGANHAGYIWLSLEYIELHSNDQEELGDPAAYDKYGAAMEYDGYNADMVLRRVGGGGDRWELALGDDRCSLNFARDVKLRWLPDDAV